MMLPTNLIFVLYVAVRLHCSAGASVWEGLFLEADLTFVLTQQCNNSADVGFDFTYFGSVMAENLNTPIRLLYRMPSDLILSGKFYLHEAILEKVRRHQVIFIPLDNAKGYEFTRHKPEYPIHHVEIVFRPNYIFARTGIHRDVATFAPIARFIRSAKLILFLDGISSPLFIPCLTCDPVSIFSQPDTITSLSNISQIWAAKNRDMHKYLVFVNDKVDVKCGLLHGGVVRLPDQEYQQYPDFCPVATIAEKYNLSLQEYQKDYNVTNQRNFGLALFHKTAEALSNDYVYQVDLVYIKFVTITNPPSPGGSGIDTFVLPLDMESWICLFVTIFRLLDF